MTRTAALSTTSPDGTTIAYFRSGHGSPLLLVHGAMSDHTRFAPLAAHLEANVTVFAMDRRGRGGSGDAAAYDIAREFEDVAAVADAIAQETGTAVDVYGHSYGGLCVFGAAPLTSSIGRLMLYEGWPITDPSSADFPPGVADRFARLLAKGDRDAALQVVMRDFLLLSDDDLAAVRAQPSWPARMAAVHTLPREVHATVQRRFDPSAAEAIANPTLLLTGSESSDPAAADTEALAAALPNARVEVIEGQGHVADVVVPDVMAAHLLAYVTTASTATPRP